MIEESNRKSISTRDFKKVTLWLSVSFKGEKNKKRDLFCKTVNSAVAVKVKWTSAGAQNQRHIERCLWHYRHISRQNWRSGTVFPNCIRQKQTPESPCETAPPGDVAQAGKVPHGTAQLSFLLQPPCGCVLSSRSDQVYQLVSSRDLLRF